MSYNRLQTMRDNIEAIRLVLSLGVAGRTAQTAEEREILHKYSGFGGLKCILNDANELADAAKWSKSDIELFAPTVELRRLIHDYSHDDKEFNRYMESLKASTLTAFYTDNRIVDAISDALKYQGVEIKRFLEPSAGQGAFIDSFLRNDKYPGAEVLAYEKDLLTGKILSALHPSILTRVEGFEKIERNFAGYFDVAASNIPFGDFAVADPAYAVSKEIAYRQSTKAIHNYFFLKALDQVREGGLVAFIASQGVMNAASPFIRMEMVKRADLVAALRLPNNTFSDNAGTDAGSDLIILQKHTGKKILSADDEFFIQSIVDRGTKVPGNKYLMAFPQNVICTDAKVGIDPYGKPAIIYTHKDGIDGIAGDLRKALDETLHLRLNLELYNSNGIKPPTPDPVTPTPKPTPKQEAKVVTQKAEKKSSLTNTPLMQQYQEMKKKHPDAVLLFRVGDFYEIFGKDAVEASEVLGITLTRRANGRDNYIELAGFPHHALDTYLPKLVRAGKRVAICEQLEDPKLKKTTKQKVVETITPNQPPKAEPEPFIEQPTFEDVKVSKLESPALLKYLADRGIPRNIAQRWCVQVDYRLHGKDYYAIGFENSAHGFELRNSFYKGSYPPKHITHIAGGNARCNVFEGFIDFLSAERLGLNDGFDSVVLNSVANVGKALTILPDYSVIACYLDNDEAGQAALARLRRELDDKVMDKSALYPDHKDLSEFLVATQPKISNNSKLKL